MKAGDRVRQTARSGGRPFPLGTIESVAVDALGPSFIHVRWDGHGYGGATVAMPDWTVERASAVDQLADLGRAL
jgi:hypothetical protein